MKRYFKYFLYFLGFILASLFLTAIGILIKKYSNDSSMDPLAFTGAVIGGIVTLIGVRITLKNQYRSDFMREYPKRRKMADDILKRFDSMTAYVEQYANSDNKASFHILENFMNLLRDSDNLRLTAAELDETFYLKTKEYLNLINHWYQLFISNNPNSYENSINNINQNYLKLSMATDIMRSTLLKEIKEHEKLVK